MNYHVRVTVKDKEGSKSYQEGVNYTDKALALEAGKKAWDNTKDAIMVEVFEAGIARPALLLQ